MREFHCPMCRGFGELIYIGLLSVVLPYQSYLETVRNVVIDDSEVGGWGLGLGKSPLFRSPLYLIGPILIFVLWRRINIRPHDEKNYIERQAGEKCDR